MAAVLFYNFVMEIVSIKQEYTDYLYTYDNRVSKNIDKEYVRPYLGVVFRIKNLAYFAPLTSSGKGKKLAQSPKPESLTFYPISNCKLGGINLNNMIPLVEGVYRKYTDIVNLNPTQKFFHENQLRVLRKNESYIRNKAMKIYRLKVTGRLYPNYDNVTCDFKKLEEAAMNYKPTVKTSLQNNPIADKYGLTEEQYDIAKKFAEKFDKPLEQVIRSNIAFAPDSHYDSSIKSNVIAEETAKRKQKNKTQEKNISKPVAVKTKKSNQDQNSR